MKKLLLIALSLTLLAACGKSEEELKAEKQKEMSDKLNADIAKMKDKLTEDTNQLNREIKISKAKGD